MSPHVSPQDTVPFIDSNARHQSDARWAHWVSWSHAIALRDDGFIPAADFICLSSSIGSSKSQEILNFMFRLQQETSMIVILSRQQVITLGVDFVCALMAGVCGRWPLTAVVLDSSLRMFLPRRRRWQWSHPERLRRYFMYGDRTTTWRTIWRSSVIDVSAISRSTRWSQWLSPTCVHSRSPFVTPPFVTLAFVAPPEDCLLMNGSSLH